MKPAPRDTPWGRYGYLHTIDGRAAYYVPGMQICYINQFGSGTLAKSLKQIRAEQKASAAWRIKQSYDDHSNDYGYRRVRLP